MALKIVTPQTLWEGFVLDITDCELVSEKSVKGVAIKEYYVSRWVANEVIRIFFKTAETEGSSSRGFVFLLQSLGERVSDEDLVKVTEFGYSAVTADFAGVSFERAVGEEKREPREERYTIYPEKLKYLNYAYAKENLFGLGDEADNSPIYHYTCNARYVLAALKEKLSVENVAVIAFKESVTTGFHLAATESLACFITLQGCGWQITKDGEFISEGNRDFTEAERIAVAGVEAQSYADKVKCPVMALLSTGYKDANFDRMSDTLGLINENVYSIGYLTVGTSEYLDYKAGKNTLAFLDKYLNKNDKRDLPESPVIEHSVTGGKSVITATVLSDALTVEFFGAASDLPHEKRVWKRFGKFVGEEIKGNEYVAEYVPQDGTESCEFFVRVEYKNGFTASSAVIVVDYKKHDVKYLPDFKVIYSSSSKTTQRFEAVDLTVGTVLDFKTDNDLPEIEKGIAGIKGLSCVGGIKTLLDVELNEDSILVFDACSETDVDFSVELISDEYGPNKKVYSAAAFVTASSVWNKVQLELKKFKTVDGQSLKNFSEINVLRITKGDFLINNVVFI